MCRLCLVEIGSLYDLETIFIKTNDESTNVLDVLNRIVESRIKQDSQSFKICSDCINATAAMFKFILQCDSSSVFVAEYLYNNSTKSHDSNKSLDNSIDLDEMCRLCLAESGVLSDLLKTTFINADDQRSSVLDFLNKVVESPIKCGLQPLKICADCKHACAEMFKLKLQCDASSFLVQECLNNDFVEEQIIIKPIDINSSQSCENTSEDFNCNRYLHGNEAEEPEEFADSQRIGPVRIICELCGKLLKTSRSLKHHVLRHQKDELFWCNICGKQFTEKTLLAKHLESHCVKKIHACEECGREFRLSRYLKLHQRIHSNIRSYLCVVCGKTFRQPTSLTYHMRIHTQKRPYACEVCDKRFQVYGHYRTHKLVHTGERPFSCEWCGKGFTKKFDLKRHVSLVHNQTKNFLCKICKKQFACEIYLRHHMMKHTLQWSHVCQICKKGFCRGFMLRRHSKICSMERFEKKILINKGKEKSRESKIVKLKSKKKYH